MINTTTQIHFLFTMPMLCILWLIDASTELPVPILPMYLHSEQMPSADEASPVASLLAVYPTLASDEVFITYHVYADGVGVLEITGLDGRILDNINLAGHNGLYCLDVKQYAAGIYLASLRVNDLIIATEKFTVIKN